MELLIGMVALLAGFVVALLAMRKRATGHLPDRSYAGLIAVTIVFEVIGTIWRASGVLLSVPVLAAGIYVLYKSDWRWGDAAVAALFLAGGMGLATFIEGALHLNTGSQADQAALLLVFIGTVLSIGVMLSSLFSPAQREPSSGRVL